ncbi:MAG: adenosylcobinamide-GDP ribazoletransferase [Lachnospiraceae bacterium]
MDGSGNAVCALFFPAIGIVIGAVVCVFMWIAQQVRLGEIAVCCIGTSIPLLITGGIHMDDFLTRRTHTVRLRIERKNLRS